MSTTSREFRNRFAKYGLERAKCTNCGRFDDPTAVACYHCGETDLEEVSLSPEGEVLTFVVQHFLPEEFETPLPIAIVETLEGGKVLGMFTEVSDPHDIEIGEEVTIELKRFDRKDGQMIYEPKLRRKRGGDE